MNILMISDVYFPRVNGVSTSIATFREALARLGHRVTLIAPDYRQAIRDDDAIIRIASRYLVLDPEDRMLRANHIMALEFTLREQGFDLVHVQTPFIAHRAGVELARRLQLPVVETYHTWFEEYLFHYVPFLPRALMRSAARWFTRRQCNRVDAVIVPSRAMHEVLQDYGVISPVSIVPTGIEPAEMQRGSRARFCAAHGIDGNRRLLVHIGRVAHEKNIGFLLEVVARVRRSYPDVLLIIAGEGPARKSLQARAQELGLQKNVHFIGYLARGPALWDCYSAGDVFVFASATETQGLVLLEAMALGVPVVSTAVMGTRDILEAGQGALVAAEEVTDFAGQVVRLLRDEDLRRRLANEGRAYVREWTAERHALRLVDFYQQVAGWPSQVGIVADTGC